MATPHTTPSPDRHPTGNDERPSIRIGTAAAMLRRGRPALGVAEATKVPLALVELINEHLGPAPTRPSRPRPTHPRPITGPPAHHARIGLDSRARPDPPHHPRGTRVVLTALLGWVTSTVLITAAGIFHLPALAAASLILTLVIVTTLVRTVNPRPTPPLPDRD